MIAVTGGQTRKVIMVVEDDSLPRESLSLMLHDFGYSVVDAEDADEAIGVAVKSGQSGRSRVRGPGHTRRARRRVGQLLSV